MSGSPECEQPANNSLGQGPGEGQGEAIKLDKFDTWFTRLLRILSLLLRCLEANDQCPHALRPETSADLGVAASPTKHH